MTLIILDPNLGQPHGHHMEWDLAIATAARERDQDVLIVANKECPLPSRDGIEIVPWFSQTCYAVRGKDPVTGRFDDFAWLNDTLAEELALLPRERFRVDDAVLVPTLTEKHLLGYVSWIKTFDPARAPLFVVHLMFPSGLDAPGADGALSVADPFQALFYRLAFRRAEEEGAPVHFFGGGRQLAREFSELVGRRIEAHPIPNCPRRRRGEIGAHPRPAALLFAGDAKVDKGFLLVPDLADRLCAAHPDWDFLIHANIGAAWGAALDAYRALIALARRHPNLTLRVDRLSRDEYLDLMEAADCLVCTYDPAVYARKSSGVVWEAISLGMPVLVPAATWMEGEAKEWGAGYAGYAAWSVEGIAGAFARFVTDLPALRQQSARAAGRYHAFNGPAALINQIGRLWAPRMLAASLAAQPGRRTLGMEQFGGPGWYDVETADGAPARWIAKEIEIAFEWPFTTPWQLELVALKAIGAEQVTKARATVAGEPAATHGIPDDKGGGRVVVTGRGAGRDAPEVRVRVALPWVFRPPHETRELGLLVREIVLAPAEDGTGEAGGPRLEILTPVTASDDGKGFALAGPVSGLALLDPRRRNRIRFDILTGGPAAARMVRLFVNGFPVTLTIAATGPERWEAVAACEPDIVAPGGYRSEWDLVPDPGIPAEAPVWISGLSVDGMEAVPTAVPSSRAAGPVAVAPPTVPPGIPPASAACTNARLDEHYRADGYEHLDIMLSGVSLAGENWDKVKFKFCLTPSRRYLEFRRLPDWPNLFSSWQDAQADRFGPYMHIGDHQPVLPGTATLSRDQMILQAIFLLLPRAVEAIVGEAAQNPEERDAWIRQARSASHEWLAAMQRHGIGTFADVA